MTPTSEQELRTFVGKRADYYLNEWRPALDEQSSATGFNVAGMFLSGLWLPYRKMYLVTLIFYGALVAETALEELVYVGVLGRSEPPAGLRLLVGLVAGFVCGLFGNSWYLAHARKKIASLRSNSLEGNAYFEALGKVGGTSLGAVLLSLLLAFILTAILLLLIDVVAGVPL